MKTHKIMIIFTLALFLINTMAIAEDNPCDGIDIKWMQQHVPIPPAKILSKTPESGLCQVVLKIGNEYVPTYAGKDFVLAGEMFRSRVQVTQEKIETYRKEAMAKNIDSLKDVVAIKYTPENSVGKSVYVLTDPLCPYCNKAGKDLQSIADETGVNFNIVFANVHGPKGEAKIKEAVCGGYDFAKYNSDDWKHLPAQNTNCQAANELWDKTQQVVAKIGLQGVPAFITENGGFVSGANMPALRDAINQMVHSDLQANAQ